MNVAKALIVTCRASELVLRSICTRRTTLTAAPMAPQIEARRACSKLNAAAKSPRAITRKHASHDPANFSAAMRTSPPARGSSNRVALSFRLGMSRPLMFFGPSTYKIPPTTATNYRITSASIRGDGKPRRHFWRQERTAAKLANNAGPGGLAVWVQPKEYKLVVVALAPVRERAGLTQQQLATAAQHPHL
jgi:hypothetical protein